MSELANQTRRFFQRRLQQLTDHSGLGYLYARLRSRGQRDAVFIWIPKNAGSSLWPALDLPKLKLRRLVKHHWAGRGRVTFGHMDFPALVRAGYVSEDFARRAFKFAFVRNPYDRAVSLYHYLETRGDRPEDMGFLDFCRTLERRGCEDIGFYNVRGWSQCNPQVRWLRDIDLAFLGRYESLADDLRRLQAELGVPATELPHVNASVRRHFADYYCEEAQQIVEHLYRDDFAQLAYPVLGRHDMLQRRSTAAESGRAAPRPGGARNVGNQGRGHQGGGRAR